MRVVQYSGFVDPRGRSPPELLDAWTTLVDVATAVAAAGIDVTVVQAASRRADLERDGVRFLFVPEPRVPGARRRPGLGALVPPRRSVRVAAELAPELVHVQGLGFPLHVRALARRLPGVPLLVQDHADWPKSGWRGALQRWGLAHAHAVAFTAAEQAEPFVRRGLLRADLPVHEVLEGSPRLAPVDRERSRADTGLAGDPAVLWVGHLTPGKDPLSALRAVERARRALPELRFWMIYRRTELLDEVRAWLEEHPETAVAVELVGSVPHPRMPAYLSAADVLLSASHREGSGYAVLEARACGAAVCATDIPSHRRILAGAPGTALAPVGSAEALAAGLVELARAPADRREAVRMDFEERLSPSALARELAAAYHAVRERHAG